MNPSIYLLYPLYQARLQPTLAFKGQQWGYTLDEFIAGPES